MSKKLCKIMPPVVERFLNGTRVYSENEVIEMLTEIQLEIEEKHREEEFMNDWSSGYNSCLVDGYNVIQQKINALKEGRK